MTDKMFADILCRSLLEIGNAIIRMVRAVEKNMNSRRTMRHEYLTAI